MGNQALSLGSVVFRDLEVPEKISFGGRQRVAVQDLLGGGRVVNALGIEEGVIRFSGIFSGGDAASRARTLDAERASGTAMKLVWGDYFYIVVVAEFAADYRQSNLIPFAVSCVVVESPAMMGAALETTVANLVTADLLAAMGLSGQAGISAAGLGTAALAPYAVTQALLGSAITAGGQTLMARAAGFNGASDAYAGVAALGGIVGASARLAAQTAMGGYVARAAVNVADILP
jgi:hypothetical protein